MSIMILQVCKVRINDYFLSFKKKLHALSAPSRTKCSHEADVLSHIISLSASIKLWEGRPKDFVLWVLSVSCLLSACIINATVTVRLCAKRMNCNCRQFKNYLKLQTFFPLPLLSVIFSSCFFNKSLFQSSLVYSFLSISYYHFYRFLSLIEVLIFCFNCYSVIIHGCHLCLLCMHSYVFKIRHCSNMPIVVLDNIVYTR